MYSNNIVNVQVSTTNLNAHTKNVWKLIVCTSYEHVSQFIVFQKPLFAYVYIIYLCFGAIWEHLGR